VAAAGYLSNEELAPNVAVRAAALYTQSECHKVPELLQLIDGIHEKINGLLSLGR
jgi:hypothetical protein